MSKWWLRTRSWNLVALFQREYVFNLQFHVIKWTYQGCWFGGVIQWLRKIAKDFPWHLWYLDESIFCKGCEGFNPLTPCIFSESWLREFQPRLAAQATCQTAHSRYVALRAEHALLYTVEKAHCSVACGSIHASTFPLLQMGPVVKLVIFMQIKPFHFLTTNKRQSPYIQEPG